MSPTHSSANEVNAHADAHLDSHFMRLALSQAALAAQAGEVPVGAVVVRAGQVLGVGHNSPLQHNDPTAHAEINALRAAAQAVGNYRLDDCTLYVTLEPCTMCSGALLNARLKRVVFGATEPKTGALQSVLRVMDSPQLNHQTQWQGGVLADECAALLQAFFQQRRQALRDHKTPLREDALRPSDALWQTHGLPRHWSRFESDWPSLQGLRLHWFDNRDPEIEAPAGNHSGAAVRAGQPLTVFLHGLHDWSAAFLPQLQSTPHAVALDLPGFGLSDKPKKESFHSLDWHAQVLLEFLQHIAVAHGKSACDLVASEDLRPWLARWGTNMPGVQIRYAPSPATFPETVRNAPYPDRGHQAGPRAWQSLLASGRTP